MQSGLWARTVFRHTQLPQLSQLSQLDVLLGSGAAGPAESSMPRSRAAVSVTHPDKDTVGGRCGARGNVRHACASRQPMLLPHFAGGVVRHHNRQLSPPAQQRTRGRDATSGARGRRARTARDERPITGRASSCKWATSFSPPRSTVQTPKSPSITAVVVARSSLAS